MIEIGWSSEGSSVFHIPSQWCRLMKMRFDCDAFCQYKWRKFCLNFHEPCLLADTDIVLIDWNRKFQPWISVPSWFCGISLIDWNQLPSELSGVFHLANQRCRLQKVRFVSDAFRLCKSGSPLQLKLQLMRERVKRHACNWRKFCLKFHEPCLPADTDFVLIDWNRKFQPWISVTYWFCGISLIDWNRLLKRMKRCFPSRKPVVSAIDVCFVSDAFRWVCRRMPLQLKLDLMQESVKRHVCKSRKFLLNFYRPRLLWRTRISF